MRWTVSWRADPKARAFADRHYTRRSHGAKQFVPPGRCLVLVHDLAYWTTSWPLPEYTTHQWPGAWVCSAFRNESADTARPMRSSELVLEAVAATRACFGEPPAPHGMVTFVDPTKVRHKRDPGRCFLRAGFVEIGWTPGGHGREPLLVLGLRPERCPPLCPRCAPRAISSNERLPMAENSKIEWTDHTFNALEGCEKVSPGCKNCYAETRNRRYHAGENWGPGSHRLQRSEAYWRQPLKWNAEAQAAGERRRVFCASLADVFEDHPDWVAPRERLFALILATPNLDWLLLTKRPQNIVRLWPRGLNGPSTLFWPNIWLGTTVEDQQRANERIPRLIEVPAVVRFLSVEPQLEAVDLSGPWPLGAGGTFGIDWVICGGESGPNSRPFDLTWARSLRDQCAAGGAAFFMKQIGMRTRVEPTLSLFFKKGEAGDPATWPGDLRVRQFPEVRHG